MLASPNTSNSATQQWASVAKTKNMLGIIDKLHVTLSTQILLMCSQPLRLLWLVQRRYVYGFNDHITAQDWQSSTLFDDVSSNSHEP